MRALGNATITRTRYSGAVDPATGMRMSGTPTTATFTGSVQPLTGRELEQFPDAADTTSMQSVFIGGTPDVDVGDDLDWGDGAHEVLRVDRWTEVQPHVEAYCRARPT